MYTVMMATRAEEPFILEALDSIRAQTVTAERVVVVVNGPKARESHLLTQIPEFDGSVTVRVLDEAGMMPALADALATVTTEYVAVLDADDLWAPEKQARQLAVLQADPTIDAVGCEAANFTADETGARAVGRSAVTRLFSAVTFRRDVFERCPLPDPSVSHFAWLVRWWTHADAAGVRTTTIPYRGLHRRVHDSNGWVTDREVGRRVLLSELRQISRQRLSAPAPGGAPA